MNKIGIKKNARILFIGDSITDCGRDKTDRHGLTGYNRLVCERLGDVEGFNRGVNGEACAAILSRLRRECEDIRPDVISVLAGINDTSERGDPPHMASTEEFFASYRTLLQTAREYTPQLLVIEPFFILKDTGMDGARNALIDRIYSIRRLAAVFQAAYVPMNGIFAEYGVSFGAERYTTDCVHLTAEGNALLAEEWLKRAVRI